MYLKISQASLLLTSSPIPCYAQAVNYLFSSMITAFANVSMPTTARLENSVFFTTSQANLVLL
jgi:hypothetical protein